MDYESSFKRWLLYARIHLDGQPIAAIAAEHGQPEGDVAAGITYVMELGYHSESVLPEIVPTHVVHRPLKTSEATKVAIVDKMLNAAWEDFREALSMLNRTGDQFHEANLFLCEERIVLCQYQQDLFQHQR